MQQRAEAHRNLDGRERRTAIAAAVRRDKQRRRRHAAERLGGKRAAMVGEHQIAARDADVGQGFRAVRLVGDRRYAERERQRICQAPGYLGNCRIRQRIGENGRRLR